VPKEKPLARIRVLCQLAARFPGAYGNDAARHAHEDAPPAGVRPDLRPALARAEDVLEIPEPCGSHRELAREIAALRASSRSAYSVDRPWVRLVCDGAGCVLTVELADGRRVLRDPDCRALFRAAIGIAALGHESSVENVLDASATGPVERPKRPNPCLRQKKRIVTARYRLNAVRRQCSWQACAFSSSWIRRRPSRSSQTPRSR
jgi:hypothetical protein